MMEVLRDGPLFRPNGYGNIVEFDPRVLDKRSLYEIDENDHEDRDAEIPTHLPSGCSPVDRRLAHLEGFGQVSKRS
jgi:hypothetical protein